MSDDASKAMSLVCNRFGHAIEQFGGCCKFGRFRFLDSIVAIGRKQYCLCVGSFDLSSW